jgi:hypothetical protein
MYRGSFHDGGRGILCGGERERAGDSLQAALPLPVHGRSGHCSHQRWALHFRHEVWTRAEKLMTGRRYPAGNAADP